MKTHSRKKHRDPTVTQAKEFPQQCGLCDLILNDKQQLKIHKRTHSYSLVQFRCDLCDFMGYDETDMDVHAAKFHCEKSECGFEAKHLEELEMHLASCEYYFFICGPPFPWKRKTGPFIK